jgi:hypothetical protein
MLSKYTLPLLGVGLSLTAGCATGRGSPRSDVRALLQAAVTQSVAENPDWRDYAAMVADSLVIESVPSGAVPGFVYYRGVFLPPHTADVAPFGAVAASRSGRSLLIATPNDWSLAVGSWYPPDASSAATACAEIAIEAGRFKELKVLFRDSVQLAYLTNPNERAALLGRLRAPRAQQTSPGVWEAAVWLLRLNESVEFRCEFRRGDPNLALTTSVVSRIGVGLAPIM